MSYARGADLSISLSVKSIAVILAAMTFSPWLAFAFAPSSLQELWFVWIPITSGALLVFLTTLGTQWHYRLLLTLIAPLLLWIPTNIVGHMLAHLLSNACYD